MSSSTTKSKAEKSGSEQIPASKHSKTRPSSSLFRMAEWSWANSGPESITKASSRPLNPNDTSSNGRFIPEAERGWKRPPTSPSLDENAAQRQVQASNKAVQEDELDSDDIFGDPARGYAHDPSMSRAYVNPLHRNPTAKQAFYDTHFGDSSLTLATKQMKKKVVGLGMLKSLSSSGKERKAESPAIGTIESPDTHRDNFLDQTTLAEEEEGDSEDEIAEGPTLLQSPGQGLHLPAPPLPKNLSARMLRQTVSVNSELDEATSPAEMELVASIEEGLGVEALSSQEQDQNQNRTVNPSARDAQQSNLWSTFSSKLGFVRSSIAQGLPSLDGLATSVTSSPLTKSFRIPATPSLDPTTEPYPAMLPSSKQKSVPRSPGLPIGLGWEQFPRESSLPSSSKLPPTVRTAARTWSALSEIDWTVPEVAPTIHRDVKASEVFKHLKGNVVILGGYRGSILRDSKTKEMMWIPIKVGVKLRNPKLELGLDEASQTRSEELCYSSGGVVNIGRLVDMGKRLHERCNSRKGCTTFDFGYDWRLSLRSQSPKLISFLSELKEATEGKEGAHVIAHSMGGLLVLHAISQAADPSIFKSVVFASSPFNGTPNMLGPLMWGDAALKNDTICSPRATFSFRSSFYLLPRDGRCFELEIKRRKKGGEQAEREVSTLHKDADFLTFDTWTDFGLSPCLDREWKASQDPQRSRSDIGFRQFDKTTSTSPSAPNLVQKPKSGFPDLSMASSPDHSAATENNDAQASNNLTDEVADKAAEAVSKVASGAIDRVQSSLRDPQGLPERLEDGDLMEENTETPKVEGNSLTEPVNGVKNSDATFAETMQQDRAQAEAWDYLKRTLEDVKTFDHEVLTGFDQDKLERGLYPPISILTSGRTPTVRGALVSKKGWDESEDEDEDDSRPDNEGDGWKKDIRDGNYSRMLYGPGDGVILRRSAVALPGRWSELLVKDSEMVQLEAEKERLIQHPDEPPSRKKYLSTPLSLTERLKSEIDHGVVETAHRHVTLLSDLCGIGICLEANRRAEACRKQDSKQS